METSAVREARYSISSEGIMMDTVVVVVVVVAAGGIMGCGGGVEADVLAQFGLGTRERDT